MTEIEAVGFDLDGALVDSEHLRDEVREDLARESGGRSHDRAQAEMMGMSSAEWSRYMHDVIGLSEAPAEISDEVVGRFLARYKVELPLVDGAVATVKHLAGSFRLAVASSSQPHGDRRCSHDRRARAVLRGDRVVVSRCARKARAGRLPRSGTLLDVPPERCAAIEVSRNRLRAAHAAGMRVIAIPHRHYPPSEDGLAVADVRLRTLGMGASRSSSGTSSSGQGDTRRHTLVGTTLGISVPRDRGEGGVRAPNAPRQRAGLTSEFAQKLSALE